MILYIKSPKDSTQKLLDLINEFSKVSRGKEIKILEQKKKEIEKKIRES